MKLECSLCVCGIVEGRDGKEKQNKTQHNTTVVMAERNPMTRQPEFGHLDYKHFQIESCKEKESVSCIHATVKHCTRLKYLKRLARLVAYKPVH